MMTVNEVSKLTGVSIRTLQYYDKIGLLHPAEYTEAGYRLYDDAALETLQQILLFRELEFPLKDIKKIVGSPDFDRSKALAQQIELLTLKKEHLENLIDLAKGLKLRGVRHLKFDAFDTRKIDEYAAQAKASWGTTPAYREFEEKSKGRTREQDQNCPWPDGYLLRVRRHQGRGPGLCWSAGAGEETAGLYHAELLHLYERDPERTRQNVRRRR